ncbi:hypothetical protein EH223_02960 [candidate division KSB1 bacterium]|nr:hypothetical protein [candidate division KSB1 bacterium]RQW06101.1 MAG: hypothetical protein EH223_02960 [candidate division KSB1 bacterium]
MSQKKQIFPRHFWFGLFLLGFAWSVNWSCTGLRTHLLFFPLWLGYCLVVDGLVFRRKGTSLFTRSWQRYIGLFLVSAPAWWLFELINMRTQNWHYMGRELFTNLEYGLLASLSFSTVIPAVFGTAELVSTFRWIKDSRPFLKVPAEKQQMLWYFIAGWTMLGLLLMWPRYFYPLVWLSVYFIIEPINVWLDNCSLFDRVKSGDWRPVWALWLGCLICGFFWEFWNYWSYPKWTYTTPFVQFVHVFEMPVIGYLGYVPFSMELFALYHLVLFLVKKESLYIEI